MQRMHAAAAALHVLKRTAGATGGNVGTTACLPAPFCRRTCNVPPPPPPFGSQCASYPPANFYTCCLNKAVNGQTDP